MSLVDYPESDDDEAEYPASETALTGGGLESKRDVVKAQPKELPPLPEAFHDLYASNVRISKSDDPSLHGGRQRQAPHVEGQWPTHVYLEYSLLKQAEAVLQGHFDVRSLLKSDLEADLPLHISLSQTLMLATEQRQSFIDALDEAIAGSHSDSFLVTFDALRWVPNQENNRWFLVLQVRPPSNEGLHRLLEASNRVAQQFKQPTLYTQHVDSSRVPNSAIRYPSKTCSGEAIPFHVSMGWTLQRPVECHFDEKFQSKVAVHAGSLSLNVQTVKVKIGNNVTSISLQNGASAHKGTIGI
ncbi:MAG: hypothetical protein Q9174_005809 [Haloplaca sp. 1 TL-2023]